MRLVLEQEPDIEFHASDTRFEMYIGVNIEKVYACTHRLISSLKMVTLGL